MKQSNARRWGTNQELDYLKSIGRNSEMVFCGRSEMLKRYYEASLKRDDWGRIDGDVVISSVTKLMTKEAA